MEIDLINKSKTILDLNANTYFEILKTKEDSYLFYLWWEDIPDSSSLHFVINKKDVENIINLTLNYLYGDNIEEFIVRPSNCFMGHYDENYEQIFKESKDNTIKIHNYGNDLEFAMDSDDSGASFLIERDVNTEWVLKTLISGLNNEMYYNTKGLYTWDYDEKTNRYSNVKLV